MRPYDYFSANRTKHINRPLLGAITLSVAIAVVFSQAAIFFLSPFDFFSTVAFNQINVLMFCVSILNFVVSLTWSITRPRRLAFLTSASLSMLSAAMTPWLGLA